MLACLLAWVGMWGSEEESGKTTRRRRAAELGGERGHDMIHVSINGARVRKVFPPLLGTKQLCLYGDCGEKELSIKTSLGKTTTYCSLWVELLLVCCEQYT